MSARDPNITDPPPASGESRNDPQSDGASDEPPHEEHAASGGSGTAGPSTAAKDQAGSYARDAEQDPERERHGRTDADQ